MPTLEAVDCRDHSHEEQATGRRRPHHQPSTSPAEPDDEGGDDDQEEDPDEARATSHRDPRTEVAAHDVGCGHQQRELPDHRALGDEDDQCGEVGRPVGELGLGRGLEEVVAQQADQREDEEGAGAGADRAVVEADRQTGEEDGESAGRR